MCSKPVVRSSSLSQCKSELFKKFFKIIVLYIYNIAINMHDVCTCTGWHILWSALSNNKWR